MARRRNVTLCSIVATLMAAGTWLMPFHCANAAEDEINAEDTAPKTTQFRLHNGLQIIVIPDHRLPVVTHGIWYRVGSADDPEHLGGLAHFVEHMMFKGTRKYPGNALDQFVNRVGGGHQATTTPDVTYYYQRLPKEHLARIMDMEADRMVNLHITDDDVASEREVVRQERKERIDNDPVAGFFHYKVQPAFYPDHPYRKHGLGSDAEIDAITRGDILRFHKKHYVPNNAVLVVAGDVTAAEMRTLAGQTYGQIPPGPNPAPGAASRPLSPITVRRVTITHERVAQESIGRRYRIPSPNRAKKGETEALRLLETILGSPIGRLYRRLVIEQGVATALSVYRHPRRYGGSFAIEVTAASGATLGDVEEALDAFCTELHKSGITQEELQLERNTIFARTIYSYDNQLHIALAFGLDAAKYDLFTTFEEDLRAYKEIRIDDINRVIRKYLVPEGSVTYELYPALPPLEMIEP